MPTQLSSLGLSLGLTLHPPVLAALQEPETSPTVPESAEGSAPAAESEEPKVLYVEGKKAYRLGNFDEAIELWEKAYNLSERPQFLYNLSLAYRGLYDDSKDVAHLEKARTLMESYLIVARADPEIEVDDAEERLVEFDDLLTKVAVVEDEPEPPDPTETGSTNGLRIAGIAGLAGGGALFATGTALGIFFGLRGREYDQELSDAIANRPDFCADESSTSCMDQDGYIEQVRSNGRSANLGLGLSLGLGAGLGAVGLGVGAYLFVRSKKTEPGPAVVRLRVVPTGRGIAVSGRF